MDELRSLYERFKDGLESDAPALTTTVEGVDTDKSQEPEREDENQEGETGPQLTTMIERIGSGEMYEGAEEAGATKDVVQSTKRTSKAPDIIDCIMRHLSTADKRNRRQVIRQLKLMVRFGWLE